LNASAQYFLLFDLSNDIWLHCCRLYDYCDRTPGDFGAVSVSRVLHFVQSEGLQNAWNKTAAQKIESSWCERVTSMPALMCSLLFCCIFFCSSLFYSILFCFSLFSFILFYFIFLYCILFYSISVPFHYPLFNSVSFYSILILFV